MNDKLVFAAQQYTSLLVFAIAFWGLGRTALACCNTRAYPVDRWLLQGLAIVLGLGLATVALQSIAAAGLLRRSSINLLLALGWALALLQLARSVRHGPATAATAAAAAQPLQVWPYALVPLALVVPLAVSALHPPYRWDELMYHLPHAREWAATGRLQINEWLRYPYAPANLGLLYAAGLIIRGDVFTHLLHALTGAMVALLVFRLALHHGGRLAACLAASFWILLTRDEFAAAHVDMGVSAFVFGGLIAHLQWERHRADRAWLVLSGLLLGCAAGSKYQALGLLPFFFGCIAIQPHRVRNLLLWSVSLAIPCIYWYARNFLLTGDPFNPLGGSVFGYGNWSAADMRYQLFDLKNAANWPEWFLWPAALAPLSAALRRNPAALRLQIFAAFGFVVWLVTSHYDRYLMPVFPVLSVLSAVVMVQTLQWVTGRLPSVMSETASSPRARRAGGVLVAVAVSVLSVNWWINTVPKQWRNVAANEAERNQILMGSVTSYGLGQTIQHQQLGRTYQWGLEGAIYYLPNPVYGDHFGPWRYRDMDGLSARQLAEKLTSQHFETLLVHRATVPGLEAKPEFTRYFTPIAESNGDKAYKVIPGPYADQS